MTEDEYVAHIAKTAQSYIDVVGRMPGQPITDNDRLALRRWDYTKTMVSPHTAIRMAEAFLGQKRKPSGEILFHDGEPPRDAGGIWLVKLVWGYATVSFDTDAGVWLRTADQTALPPNSIEGHVCVEGPR